MKYKQTTLAFAPVAAGGSGVGVQASGGGVQPNTNRATDQVLGVKSRRRRIVAVEDSTLTQSHPLPPKSLLPESFVSLFSLVQV